MQDYRRKIAYLYAYEGGEKLGNAGFVKAEDRGGICRLAVHLRCYSRSGEDPGKVYLYFRHRQQLVGIYLGALKNRKGHWNGRGLFLQMTSRGKESVSDRQRESGFRDREEKNTWQNGMIIRWISAVL